MFLPLAVDDDAGYDYYFQSAAEDAAAAAIAYCYHDDQVAPFDADAAYVNDDDDCWELDAADNDDVVI